jgi:hypothetical protein
VSAPTTLTFSRARLLFALAVILFFGAVWFAFVAAAAPEFGGRLVAALVALIFGSFGGAVLTLRGTTTCGEPGRDAARE